jgi:tRNA A-37 threonylcarbamoyl transferase component Bud32
MKEHNVKNFINKITNNDYKFILLDKSNNKIIYKLTKGKNKILAKVYIDNFSKSLSLNEVRGHKYFKKNKFIQTPKLIFFKKNRMFNILLRDFIIGEKKRFNYFKLFNYYKFPNKKSYKKIALKNYFKKSFFNSNHNQKKLRNTLTKFHNNFILICGPSHGDLIHYNLLTNGNNNHFIDFEFFSRNRSIYFDFFTWFIIPIITKAIKYKVTFLIHHLISFFLYIIYYSFNQKYITQNFKNYQVYFDIFLFEKICSMVKIYKQSNFQNKTLKIRHLNVIKVLQSIINKRLKN